MFIPTSTFIDFATFAPPPRLFQPTTAIREMRVINKRGIVFLRIIFALEHFPPLNSFRSNDSIYDVADYHFRQLAVLTLFGTPHFSFHIFTAIYFFRFSP